MFAIEVVHSQKALKLVLPRYPESTDEVQLITEELTKAVREFIGDWRLWYDVTKFTGSAPPQAFAAATVLTLYGKSLGLTKVIVQFDPLAVESRAIAEQFLQRYEGLRVPVFLVDDQNAALRLLSE